MLQVSGIVSQHDGEMRTRKTEDFEKEKRMVWRTFLESTIWRQIEERKALTMAVTKQSDA